MSEIGRIRSRALGGLVEALRVLKGLVRALKASGDSGLFDPRGSS